MKKKRRYTTYLLFLVFIAGLSLMLYPTFANYWNSKRTSKAITEYAETVADLDDEEYERMWQEAVEYNERLSTRSNLFAPTEEELAEYESVLNIGGSGVIGYIEIESIGVSLPIYHGTSEGVLQVAVGHLDWTSLPTGGLGTHCVLSGHRGLPSAKLFTNLDQLVVGDTFLLRVLDQVLTYEVDQILIVEPQTVDALQVEEGKDYCTLVTCTPYGINTHRMLVRGHRIENAEEAASIHVTAEAIQIEPLVIAGILGIPSLILLLITSFIFGGSDNKKPNPNIITEPEPENDGESEKKE